MAVVHMNRVPERSRERLRRIAGLAEREPELMMPERVVMRRVVCHVM